MKRQTTVILLLIGAFLIFCCISAFRAAEIMARGERVQGTMRSLAAYIENYRAERGNYPSSIAEAQVVLTPGERASMDSILTNRYQDQYEYVNLTNEFSITVTQPGSLFINGGKVEKRYKVGEAFQSDKQ